MISNIRKFWLENQDGKIWKFTDKESRTFLDSPAGLGILNSYGSYRLGNAEVVNFVKNELIDITGSLYFFGSTREEVYQKYFEFMNFISKNRLMKLHYQAPNSFDSYYRYCFVQQLDKSEIESDGMILKCPVRFSVQTFWRTDVENTLVGSNELIDESKTYPLERPYSYASNKLNDMKAINRGNTESALRILIDGRSVNPTINVYDNNGIKYGALRLIGSFDKVIVESDDLNQRIQLLKDGSWLTAPYAYQDLNVGQPNEVYVTFIKLKPGESTITFNSDDYFDGQVIINWSDEYVSV